MHELIETDVLSFVTVVMLQVDKYTAPLQAELGGGHDSGQLITQRSEVVVQGRTRSGVETRLVGL
ncbi:MAG: hypothetical protein CL569_02405, partial [Alphaproteobacteria bacterium]|nr:hypothetical protein [Alphaproteobacteria bacterium]